MENYHQLLRALINEGIYKEDRTRTGTYSLFAKQLSYDVRSKFPLLTTKKVHFKSVVHELLWFISGDTNIKYLQDNGVKIWNEWANKDGDLGPVYGKQWRDFGGVDQLSIAINDLKHRPDSRRIIVSAWNPTVLPENYATFEENVAMGRQALPPCHMFFQFYTRGFPGGRFLDMQMYQRSADVFLGVPFNIASYALLLMMVAQVVDMSPGKLYMTFGDVHLYKNHVNQAKTQLQRKHRGSPLVTLNPEIKHIDDFKYCDINLLGYNPAPPIKAPIAV